MFLPEGGVVGRSLSKVPHHSKDGLGGGTVGGGVKETTDLRQTVQLDDKQTLSLIGSLKQNKKDCLVRQAGWGCHGGPE